MKQIFLAAGALLSFVACSNDETFDPLVDGPVPMTFTAGIDGVATRATAAAFEAGDVVGIIPKKDGSVETAQANVAYTYNGSAFEASSPYYFQNYDAVTFNAYYPHKEDLAADRIIGINTRAEYQTVETVNGHNWNKNDYLFASAETNVKSPSVSYTGDKAFKHVMSKFTLTLKAGDGITDLQALTGYTLHDVIVDGRFDVTTGEVSLNEDATKQDIEMTVLALTGRIVTCQPLILLPQNTGINLPLSLTVHYNGQRYAAELQLPEETKDKLAAGYHYLYTVKVSNTGLEITNASIEGWTEKNDNNGEATLK